MSKLPSPFVGKQSASNLPTPALGGSRKPGQEKNRIPQNTGAPLKGSGNSSRSTSPQSLIPQPRGPQVRQSLNEKHSVGRGVTRDTGNGRSSLRVPGQNTQYNGHVNAKNNSMLEKFKLFNNKDKPEKNKGTSKRTSSSSGFSSARSERSDSSTSLCSDNKPVLSSSILNETRDSSFTNIQSSIQPPSYAPTANGTVTNHVSSGTNHSPKSGIKGFRTKFRSSGSKGSPKNSRKEDSKSSPKSSTRSSSSSDKRNSEEIRNKPKGNERLTPALETVDNPVKQSKISSLVGKSERVNGSAGFASSKHSASRDSLSSETNKQSGLVMGGGSGIPKPTAAVKGQTKAGQVKPSKDLSDSSHQDHQPTSLSQSSSGTSLNTRQVSKVTTPNGPKSVMQKEPKEHVDNGNRANNNVDFNTPSQHSPLKSRSSKEGGPPTVAMVSPMPVIRNQARRDSNQSEAGQPNQNNNNHVEGQSSKKMLNVQDPNHISSYSVEKPSPDKMMDIHKITGTCSKMETTFGSLDKVITQTPANEGSKEGLSEESDDVIMNIKPMQPIIRASPYGYMRGLGLQSKNLPSSVHAPRYGMQPLTTTVGYSYSTPLGPNGYPPGGGGGGMKRSLSSANGTGQGVSSNGDYIDLDSLEVAAGYLSDGDMLRNGGANHIDNFDGYMSEGGASFYAKRSNNKQLLDDRPSTGTSSETSPQDCSAAKKPQQYQHHRGLDDCSSVSSGISDTFPELSTDDNCTTSSFNSEHSNPYNPLKFTLKDSGGQGGVGASVRRGGPAVGMAENGFPPRPPAQGRHVKKADSSQQTENTAFKVMTSSSHKKHSDGSKSDKEGRKERSKDKNNCNGFPLPSNGVPRKPTEKKITEGRKKSQGRIDDLEIRTSELDVTKQRDDNSPKAPHTSKSKAQNPRVQNTANSFGYAKRPSSTSSVSSNGSNTKVCRPKGDKLDLDGEDFKTAQVSGVVRSGADKPRTKVKVCGSTQTTSDLQNLSPRAALHSDGEYASHNGSNSGSLPRKYGVMKSYSLTTSAASQLSQTVRERILASGNYTKMNNPYADYTSLLGGAYGLGRERSPRMGNKSNDGSFSDSHYSNYAELREMRANSTENPYSWMRHSTGYTPSVASAPGRHPVAGSLTEAESMESLCSSASSMAAHIQHGRANSLTHSRLSSSSPRLQRSNSIRSTKSEKLYPSMLHRSEEHDPYGVGPIGHSQPTSPTPAQMAAGISRFNFPLSPMMPATSSASSGTGHSLGRSCHASYLSSVMPKITSKEEDLHGSALSLVSSNSSLYSTQEEKQAQEIRRLKRDLIDAQEKVHSLNSQLTTNAHVVAAFEQSLSNMTNRLQNLTTTAEQKDSELIDLRNTIEHLRQQSAEARNNGSNMSRQLSTDSMSSLSSACSATSHHSAASHPSQTDTDSPSCKKKKKKGWLRSSFGKAFTRGRKGSKGDVGSDQEDSKGGQSDVSAPSSPLLQPSHPPPPAGIKGSHSSGTLLERETSVSDNERVNELMKQLREKDQVLTDIRLEALTSAHQLESLKDVVNKMRSDMLSLKHDNDRLQRMMTSKSLASSQSSIQMNDVDRRFSLSDASVPSNHTDIYADLIPEGFDKDGKRVTISVIHGCHGNHEKYKSLDDSGRSVSLVGSVCVSGKTKWDLLDNLTKRVFKEYVLRVDPVANLGLSAESMHCYHVGEITRGRDTTLPELLPYGYLVGETTDIQICLKGTSQQGSVDSLAFETLIPKSIIQRYVSLLTEHRRIILCGPSGTGKSYLAQKLAEYLVVKMKKEVSPEVIATFSVDHKSSRELRQYLCHVAERCETNPEDVPSVLILDNLHHSSSLGELFDGLLTNSKSNFTPYLIGTMNQATCATTNLQLHHNFRWVLCANHMEPVRGFLGRFLRRKLVEQEARLGTRNPTLHKIIDYIPRVWQHLNKFLETHSSSDVTIGPRLFLSCPLDVNNSRVWFTDLWNYSLVPYLLEAVREGIQLYGRRAPWEDPANWVIETLPWEQDTSQANGEWPFLLRLRPEDVGYDLQTAGSGTTSNGKSATTTTQQENADPLLNMLMRLQEAANYSSPHSGATDSSTDNCDTTGTQSNL